MQVEKLIHWIKHWEIVQIVIKTSNLHLSFDAFVIAIKVIHNLFNPLNRHINVFYRYFTVLGPGDIGWVN